MSVLFCTSWFKRLKVQSFLCVQDNFRTRLTLCYESHATRGDTLWPRPTPGFRRYVSTICAGRTMVRRQGKGSPFIGGRPVRIGTTWHGKLSLAAIYRPSPCLGEAERRRRKPDTAAGLESLTGAYRLGPHTAWKRADHVITPGRGCSFPQRISRTILLHALREGGPRDLPSYGSSFRSLLLSWFVRRYQ